MPDETFAGLSLDSITVDEAGRIIVTDPQVAERLRSAPVIRNRTNNCPGANNVPRCGEGQTVNAVAGCGVPVTK
jgi:hypothetical protein